MLTVMIASACELIKFLWHNLKVILGSGHLREGSSRGGQHEGKGHQGDGAMAFATEKQVDYRSFLMCCQLLLVLHHLATEFPGCVGLRSRCGGGLYKGQV